MKNISLVLSGGGARGIAHIGVINFLEKEGFVIKNIGGTSMGAIVGAIYAEGKLKEYEEFLKNLNTKEVIKLLDFSLSSPGLIDGNKIVKKLKSFLPTENIEYLDKNFFCIATDIQNGKEIVFKKGNLLQAVHASFAIPFVFTPVINNNNILVDGGVLNNIPVNHISRKYPVIAVCANSSQKLDAKLIEIISKKTETNERTDKVEKYISKFIPKKKKNSMSYHKILDEALHLLIEKNSNTNLKNNPPEILINIPREIAGTFDFLKAEKLIEAGEYLAEKAIYQ